MLHWVNLDLSIRPGCRFPVLLSQGLWRPYPQLPVIQQNQSSTPQKHVFAHANSTAVHISVLLLQYIRAISPSRTYYSPPRHGHRRPQSKRPGGLRSHFLLTCLLHLPLLFPAAPAVSSCMPAMDCRQVHE